MRQIFVCVAIAMNWFVLATSATAGFGDFLPSKELTTAVSAVAVEKMLLGIVITTGESTMNLAAALNDQKGVDKIKKEMADAKNGGNLKELAEKIQGHSDEVGKLIKDKQAKGEKLTAEASKKASEALLPGIATIPLWAGVVAGGVHLGKNPMEALKAPSLMSALPVVPAALKGTTDLFTQTIDYLSFSGFDTSTLKKDLATNMAAKPEMDMFKPKQGS